MRILIATVTAGAGHLAAATALEEERPFLRQCDGPRRAMKQADAKPLLKACDRLADRG